MSKSYIEWSVIFAGAFVACAITTVLIQFGAAVGFTQITTNASLDANISPGFVLGTGVWLLWVQLLSSLTGGYLAGRMRMPIEGATQHESDMRDGVHGLLVWATSTLAVVAAVSFITSIAAITDNPVQDIQQNADVAAMNENGIIVFAFFAAATSLVSAVVSWWAATMGGDHRDQRADHARYFTFRTIR
jgi:hypothetical protein